MNQHVNLTFSLKYLVNFSKSASLSNVVQLMMSNEVPLLVSQLLHSAMQTMLIRYRSRTNLAKGTFGTISHLKSEMIEFDRILFYVLCISLWHVIVWFRCLSTNAYVSLVCNL